MVIHRQSNEEQDDKVCESKTTWERGQDDKISKGACNGEEGSGLLWTKHPQHVFPSPTKPRPLGGPAASLQKGSELPVPKRVTNLPVLEGGGMFPGAWTGQREGSGLPWTKHPRHVFPSPTKPLPPGGPAASLQKGSELPVPKRVANLPVLEAGGHT
ncbi:11011_t:CDS:2 [Paraglomus brasilianum]|uniref:11011_t:CDS:1 n=1 Tax=Paraglomus brasilianum TaxID=144538 RepID=A0A9N9AJM9_9GLOM|nr:11011_t:CDS:2 [Paraglomus brasilianum]